MNTRAKTETLKLNSFKQGVQGFLDRTGPSVSHGAENREGLSRKEGMVQVRCKNKNCTKLLGEFQVVVGELKCPRCKTVQWVEVREAV